MGMEPIELIRSELVDGEQVQWLGAPSFKALLLRSIPSILFGCVFAIMPFISDTVWAANASERVSNIVVITVFTMVGLSYACQALLGVCAAGRAAYAITNRRILIARHIFRKRVQTFIPSYINVLEYRVHADGTGSVFFQKNDVHTIDGSGIEKFGFFGVRDVVGAVRALDQLRLNQHGKITGSFHNTNN